MVPNVIAASTYMDHIEIRPEGTKNSETQKKNSTICFLLRKYAFTLVCHPIKSLLQFSIM